MGIISPRVHTDAETSSRREYFALVSTSTKVPLPTQDCEQVAILTRRLPAAGSMRARVHLKNVTLSAEKLDGGQEGFLRTRGLPAAESILPS